MHLVRRAVALAMVLASGTVAAAAMSAPASASRPGPAVPAPSASGAAVAFTEYSAASARTNGTRIGPSTNFGQLPAEAVGRKAVTLSGTGGYVEFTLTKPANALDLHYSIPDTADGKGRTSPLSVYVDGFKAQTLTLTSQYSWLYGFYPFTNNPADGQQQHFYDDVRTNFPIPLLPGTRVRLQLPAGAAATTIDVADFSLVGLPTLLPPAGSVNALAYGADPTGRKDSTAALQNAINAGEAKHRTVFIPLGTFQVNGHLIVDNVTVKGAGQWYTTLTGAGVGVYGRSNPTPSGNVHVSDLAVIGRVANRDDSADLNGFGGALANSTISHVFVQHTKVGMWFDGPFDGLRISDATVEDTMADGITLHDGITGSSITNSYVRDTGDDGIALNSSGGADANDTIDHDTVVLPILANNIAVYGGHDNAITNNHVTDTLTQGGGIQVGNRFGAVALSGTTTIAGNLLERAGVLDPNWQFGVGAMWFYALDEPMSGSIDVTNNTILDSPYEAVQFVGSTNTNIDIDHLTVKNVGTFVVQIQSGGSVTMSNVKASGAQGIAGVYDCGYGLVIDKGTGNSGWDSTWCDDMPPSGILQHSPGSAYFGVVDPGVTSAPQTFTISNPGPDAASLGSVRVSDDFAQTNDCGASLAVGASCHVTVTFTPSSPGNHTGTLLVGTDAPFPPAIALTGVGFDPNGNLTLGATMTASTITDGFPAANTNDANQSSYWESQDGTGGVFPGTQTLTVNLGAAKSVGRLVLKLPPGWGTRTETIAVATSTDGTDFTTVAPATGVVFDPGVDNNAATIPIPSSSAQYVRLSFTSNDQWPAAQLAEFEAYAN
ncbi:glycosyl hydrolase family 28-related protein [Rugosimonospora acidiphila]|uniref:Glycosyl hydrolase family 28-related protein n=1 Tax=Rugosimonospora acidiphila TaxID=556531 RepID=A0ABP9SCE9_9ACTN